MSGLRRFIAGAVCPRCGQTDTLFLFGTDTQRLCECVACGYRDAIDRAGDGAALAPAHDEDEVRPLRLVDPGPR